MSAPIIVVTGPPGVGKTTAADALAASFELSAVVAGDNFLGSLRNGKVEPWLPESHEQNIAIMDITLDTARSFADRGWTTVLEGIIGPWFLDVVRERLLGLDVHYAVLMAPANVCRDRFVSRDPSAVLAPSGKMHIEFAAASIAQRHAVEAGGSSAATADALLTAFNTGELRLG